jgi:hypothetical protein
MRRCWAALSLGVLLGIPAPGDADELRLLNAGIRGGAAGPNVFGGDEDERFEQYDVFLTASLPWSWYHRSGWGLSTRLMATTGFLEAAGHAGLIGTVVPLLAIGPRGSSLSLDGGVGAAVLARDVFGDQDFGGPLQVVLTFGFRFPVYRGATVGYRMQHISDARIYGDAGNGADLHMLELTYSFR